VALFFRQGDAATGRLLAIPQRLLAEVPQSATAKTRRSTGNSDLLGDRHVVAPRYVPKRRFARRKRNRGERSLSLLNNGERSPNRRNT
jgi:hypothetical protein